MDLFQQLEKAVLAQHHTAELPDLLVAPLLSVAQNPEKFTDRTPDIALLLLQVEHFDTYAGTGCFGESYGPEDILRTLMKLSVTP